MLEIHSQSVSGNTRDEKQIRLLGLPKIHGTFQTETQNYIENYKSLPLASRHKAPQLRRNGEESCENPSKLHLLQIQKCRLPHHSSKVSFPAFDVFFRSPYVFLALGPLIQKPLAVYLFPSVLLVSMKRPSPHPIMRTSEHPFG